MRVRFALFWLCLSAMGCAGPGRSIEKVWLPAYLFGAIGGGELDVRDVCPSGRAEELALGSSWSTLGVAVATLGIYTPREARLRCAPKR